MPNWVTNNVYCRGSAADLAALVTIGTRYQGWLEPLVPMPSVLTGTIADADFTENRAALAATGHADWYSWRLAHWGTKWAEHGFEVVEPDGILHVRFETAWAPPEEGLRVVSSRFPQVVFTHDWVEPGMIFAGVTNYHRGAQLYCFGVEESDIDTEVDDVHGALLEVLLPYTEEADELAGIIHRTTNPTMTPEVSA